MSRFRRLLWLSVIALASGAALSGVIALMFPQQLLTVDSGEVKADALVVLGGGTGDRPERAAQLFRAGVAPVVLVSGVGDNESNVLLLEKGGVPALNITQEVHSISTLENAKFSIPLLRQMHAHRVIIVTTWYHSRRALACFQHFAPDITFYSRPSYDGDQNHEWNRQTMRHYVVAEYVKLAGYWVCYGIWPFVKGEPPQ